MEFFSVSWKTERRRFFHRMLGGVFIASLFSFSFDSLLCAAMMVSPAISAD